MEKKRHKSKELQKQITLR